MGVVRLETIYTHAFKSRSICVRRRRYHLKTPFHVLSVLVLPNLTAEIANIVEAHASARCPREDIISFLGDSIECSCRNESDRKNRKHTLVTDFCRRYQIDGHGQEKIDEFHLAVTKICMNCH